MHDFAHIGALCKRIRESRTARGKPLPLTQQDIANQIHADNTYISHFESSGGISEDIFEAYVNCLSLYAGLSPSSKQTLLSLRDPSRRSAHYTERISLIDFDALIYQPRLVNEIRREEHPSFIMDQFWFTHAYNGPLVRLLNLKDDDLHHWQNWHVIATKFFETSPVRRRHPQQYRHHYFPPACQRFFEQISNPYLFTDQCRGLLRRIQAQSIEFENLWDIIVTFKQHYPTELERTILYINRDGRECEINTSIFTRPLYVEVADVDLQFTQVVWRPKGEPANAAFCDIAKTCNKEVRFPSEFGINHANQFDVITQNSSSYN